MDVTGLSLTISLGTLLTIASVVLGILGYRLNKKKHEAEQARQQQKDAEEKLNAAVQAQHQEDTRQKDIDLKLLSIEKDVQYIRLSVDDSKKHWDDHEKRIQVLEKKVARKGGK